jgi:hypothetical protein
VGPIHPPDWLNAGTFTEKVQPLLVNITTSAIATALGISWVYASHIRAGAKRPHPRHWLNWRSCWNAHSGPAILQTLRKGKTSLLRQRGVFLAGLDEGCEVGIGIFPRE